MTKHTGSGGIRSIAGFTLIEAMIGIAIISILLIPTFRTFTLFQWFSHEEHYRFALFQAESHMKALRTAPLDALPPEVRTVPENGVLTLKKARIVQGSVKVYCDSIEIPQSAVSVEARTIRLHTRYAGRPVVIEYAYLLPCVREGATVPRTAPHAVKPINAPATEILAARAVSGRDFAPLGPGMFSIDSSTGEIAFDGSLAGRVVELTYMGGRSATAVRGVFLTDALEVAHVPTGLRRITVEEMYGQRINRFRLSFVRAAQ